VLASGREVKRLSVKAHLFALLTAAASQFAASQAPAKDAPEIYAPASAWAMDYADDSCRLLRTFANGGDQMTISLERFGPGTGLVVSLTTSALEPRPRAESAFLAYDDNESSETNLLYTKQADGQFFVLFGSFPILREPELERLSAEQRRLRAGDPLALDDEIAAAADVTSLTIRRAFTNDIVIQLGAMAGPIRAMHGCIDELLEHWGVDAARHRSLTRRAFPAGSPQEWLDINSFPVEELRKARGGINYVRVMVDAEGKPTDCHVQRGSESDSFNTNARRILLENGKFVPALDAMGAPIASYYTTTFVWSWSTGSRSGGLGRR